eukprot:1156131-Pelagomonas_calceolata.AAC.3
MCKLYLHLCVRVSYISASLSSGAHSHNLNSRTCSLLRKCIACGQGPFYGSWLGLNEFAKHVTAIALRDRSGVTLPLQNRRIVQCVQPSTVHCSFELCYIAQ